MIGMTVPWLKRDDGVEQADHGQHRKSAARRRRGANSSAPVAAIAAISAAIRKIGRRAEFDGRVVRGSDC